MTASKAFRINICALVTLTVGGRRFEFVEGEAIRTEDSPKYTPESFAALVGRVGWRLGAQWRDADDLFMLAWPSAP